MMFTNTETPIESVQNNYNLPHKDSYTLCCSMWLFIHGIAYTCASGITIINKEEIEKLVNDTFESILQRSRRTK